MPTSKKSKAFLILSVALILFGLVMSVIGIGTTLQLFGNFTPAEQEQPVTDLQPQGGTAPAPADGNAPAPADGNAPAPADGNAPAPADGTAPAPADGAAPAEAPAPADGESDVGAEILSSFSFILTHVVPFIVYAALAVYVVVYYRKPHGNLLRYTMLFYALMLTIWSLSQDANDTSCAYILPVAAVLVGYLSGRLNKIKKNVWWMGVVAVLLLCYGILGFAVSDISFLGKLSYAFSALLEWLALCFAYLSRFDKHKQAGEAVEVE